MHRFVLLLLFVSSVFASSEAELRSLFASTYSFYPKQLKNQQEFEAKTKVLDQLWSEVRASGPTGLAVLREELNAEGQNRYFYFDGASLLITISQRPEDLALAIRAIAKADFNQLDSRSNGVRPIFVDSAGHIPQILPSPTERPPRPRSRTHLHGNSRDGLCSSRLRARHLAITRHKSQRAALSGAAQAQNQPISA